jgi:hypothetical protein
MKPLAVGAAPFWVQLTQKECAPLLLVVLPY